MKIPAVLRRVALMVIAPVVGLGAQSQNLGTISFPNSGAAAAQAPFIRGMLLYHSFEYPAAAIAFREAQQADPTFALAYAGEALTHTHQVWNRQDTAAAMAVLRRLAPTRAERRARARTVREQMYLDAVETLYGVGGKATRDTLFAAAIERIVLAHPQDDEARVLHALALLGLSQSDRVEASYMRAGAIAADVLRRNPAHPGAAHMVIHAFDDPVHAPLGLWAARAYSKIAPAAAHAQHMTTHIFLAMGMWDDVVSQNVVASGPHAEHWRAHHYTTWLGYGYLQQGRYDEARLHLLRARANAVAPWRMGERPSLVMMRAAYLITSERWTDSIVGMSLAPIASPTFRAIDAFATGYAALKRGERALAEQIADSLDAYVTADPGAALENDPRVIRIIALEIRAALMSARGRTDSAVALILEAARQDDALPVEFGPPRLPKPPRELAGEILLAAGRHLEAQREFTRALEQMPGRSRTLVGLARAAARSGDTDVAASAAGQLLRNWHSSDASVAERAEMERLRPERP